jgi:cadmium resistance protein CadD (predicted permease)
MPWIALSVLVLLAVVLVAARQRTYRAAILGYVGLALLVVAVIEVLVRTDVISTETASGLMGLAAILLAGGAIVVLRPWIERRERRGH